MTTGVKRDVSRVFYDQMSNKFHVDYIDGTADELDLNWFAKLWSLGMAKRIKSGKDWTYSESNTVLKIIMKLISPTRDRIMFKVEWACPSDVGPDEFGWVVFDKYCRMDILREVISMIYM